jgi:WXXGXW repeat (2 copies)
MRKILVVLVMFAGILLVAAPSPAQVAVGISVHIGPPALPVYPQPICPGPGYLWTPGYWAYGPDGYYWVPGTWVMAPTPGLLWTPGYWGWAGGLYAWHAGYWGPHVGFYGGINYGFGYFGGGFVGGRWDHGVFLYNTAVMHVNTTIIHNTYIDRTVIRNGNHVAFNGGPGGIVARPSRQEMAYARERHVEPTAAQMHHEESARSNRAFLASENHGHPAVMASSRPGEFSGHGNSHAFTPPEHNGTHAPAAEHNGTHAFTPPEHNGTHQPAAEHNGTHFNAPAHANSGNQEARAHNDNRGESKNQPKPEKSDRKPDRQR